VTTQSLNHLFAADVDDASDGSMRPAAKPRPDVSAVRSGRQTLRTGADGGAALLDDLHDTIKTYVVLPSPEAADAVTLWVAATHALPAFQHATRLAISSPEKRCGKSRLLDIVAGTCHKPLMTANASTAAVVRSIGDEDPPTLLIDEADTIFGSRKVAEQNEDLRGLLNAGFGRGRPTIRCVGPNQTPTAFDTFAMAALGGIGTLPDTITDRAVNITMRRRRNGEEVAQYRVRRDGPILDALREGLTEWAAEALPHLGDAEPEMPVEDRAADTWEPLVAIADYAGGTWPARARAACLKLTSEAAEADEDSSWNTRLLADVRGIYAARRWVPFMATNDLLTELKKIDESPWAEFDLTGRKLADRLKHFGIKPAKNSLGNTRGYRLQDLTDAFTRYLRPDPSDPYGPTSELREGPDGNSTSDASTRPVELRALCRSCNRPLHPALGHDVHPACEAA
jgi:hypothetical protein